MARPFNVRTKQTIARDIAALGRLRVALTLDAGLPRQKLRIVFAQIDALTRTLEDLTLDMSEPESSGS